ncbi:hypothetical protein [Vibrio atypicus]|uniref:hypothetical protein n=1 Tax=Vibrio atypicus TaxID=558271 RepID=UPI003736F9EA
MNKTFIALGVAFTFILVHFFSLMNSDDVSNNKGRRINSIDISLLFQDKALEPLALSNLYRVNNTLGSESETQNESASDSQIRLGDVDIHVRAISKVGQDYIVYVSYNESNKDKKQKLRLNEDLLGFKLVSVNRKQIRFERDTQLVEFSIFEDKKDK